jgi:co-chaperonin GroES (HSP10)
MLDAMTTGDIAPVDTIKPLPAAILSALSAGKDEATKAQEDLDAYFPDVPPGVTPLGSRVLVQIRTPRWISRGGIMFPEESRDTERDNTQVAKVIALGSLAYHNRTDGKVWVEGAWAEPGNYVRVPKYAGDRWELPIPGARNGEKAVFAIFNDFDVIGRITGDPTQIRAFF